MAHESAKTKNIRQTDFIDKYLKGRVIDIGSGDDIVIDCAEPFDLEHGDVLKIGENIYGGSWEKKVFSVVDWKTGAVKDSSELIGPCSVISAEGLIYAYNYSGEVFLVKPTETSFEIISSFSSLCHFSGILPIPL